MQETIKDYPKSEVPYWCNTNKIEIMFDRLLKVDWSNLIDLCINEDASPGVPWTHFAKTNEEFKNRYFNEIVGCTINRIVNLVLFTAPESHYSLFSKDYYLSPEHLVSAELCDPIRLFVKQEPHSLEKIAQGRYRLISSVSLIDQLVERLLFTPQNKIEIDTWTTCPSKPGMGLALDEDLVKLYYSLSHIPEPCNADISGWDWSVAAWELLADCKMRVDLNNGSNTLFARIAWNRTLCLANALFATSDGTLYKTYVPGIQKSGSFNTSSTNSRLRVLNAKLIGSQQVVAMGDDSVESFVPNAKEKYLKLGKILKMYDRCNETFEFCSTFFSKDAIYPVNWDKMLFRFLNQPQNLLTGPTFEQFMMEIRHHPKLNEIREYIVSTDWYRDKIMPQGKQSRPKPQPKPKVEVKEKIVLPKRPNGQYEVVTVKPKKHTKSESRAVGVAQFRKTPKNTFTVKSRKDGSVVVKGQSFLQEVFAYPGAESARVVISAPLSPDSINSYRLSLLAKTFQRFKFKSVVMHWLPYVSTMTNGTLLMSCLTTMEENPNTIGTNLRRYLSETESFVETPIWQESKCALPKAKYLPSYVLQADSNDINTAYQARLVAAINYDAVSKNTYLGDMMITYEVELYNATGPVAENTRNGYYSINIPAGTYSANTPMKFTLTNSSDVNFWMQYPGIWEMTLAETNTLFDNGVTDFLSGTTNGFKGGTTFYFKVSRDSTTSSSVLIILYPNLTALVADIPIHFLATVTLASNTPASLAGYAYYLSPAYVETTVYNGPALIEDASPIDPEWISEDWDKPVETKPVTLHAIDLEKESRAFQKELGYAVPHKILERLYRDKLQKQLNNESVIVTGKQIGRAHV